MYVNKLFLAKCLLYYSRQIIQTEKEIDIDLFLLPAFLLCPVSLPSLQYFLWNFKIYSPLILRTGIVYKSTFRFVFLNFFWTKSCWCRSPCFGVLRKQQIWIFIPINPQHYAGLFSFKQHSVVKWNSTCIVSNLLLYNYTTLKSIYYCCYIPVISYSHL
jgi:hypothetical protein